MAAQFTDLPVEIRASIARSLPYPSLRRIRETGLVEDYVEPKVYSEALLQIPNYLRYFDITRNTLVFIDNEGKVWLYDIFDFSLIKLDGFSEPIIQVWATPSVIYAQGVSKLVYSHTLRDGKYDLLSSDPIRTLIPNLFIDSNPYYVEESKLNVVRSIMTPIVFGLKPTDEFLQVAMAKNTGVSIAANRGRKGIAFHVKRLPKPAKVGSTTGFIRTTITHHSSYDVFLGIPQSPPLAVGALEDVALVLMVGGLYLIKADRGLTHNEVTFNSMKLFPGKRFISMHVGDPYISLVSDTGEIYMFDYIKNDYLRINHQVVAAKSSGSNLVTLDERGNFSYADLDTGFHPTPISLGLGR